MLKITTVLIIFIKKVYEKRLLMCRKCRNKTDMDLTMRNEQTDKIDLILEFNIALANYNF